MSEATTNVRTEREGHVWTVTLDRPESANAINREVLDGMRAAVGEAMEGGARCVVLTGTGTRAFCAGADLKERRAYSDEETRAFVTDISALMDEVAALPMPTIAAVNGVALGGGMELALACDVRVAVSTAQFGLTETSWGIIPGAGGTQRLPRLVGSAKAKEMILWARRIDAEEALRCGLVSEVGDLGDVLPSWLDQVCALAPVALRAAKRSIAEGAALPLAEAIRFERTCYDETMSTQDRIEALTAFQEGRPPRFEGR